MAKQESKSVAIKNPTPPPSLWARQSKESAVDTADLVIPRLLLNQLTSKAVGAGKAKIGEIMNSLTGNIVAAPDKELIYIPLTLKKYWKKFEVVNGTKKYRGTEPYTSKNADRELKETIGTVGWEYDLVIDCFGFTEDDVKNPASLPSVLSFTRTSYNAGKKISTHMKMLEMANLEYFAKLISISVNKQQNDKGIFYTFDIQTKGEDTPEAYAHQILKWNKVLNDATAKIVVDEAEDEVQTSGGGPVDESKF